MTEWLINFFENMGVRRAAEQIEYLLDPGEIPFQIWETIYAPAAATVLAYLIGLPLGILFVTGERGGIRPLPAWLMRTLNVVVNLLRSVPFLILMVLVMPLSLLIIGTSVGTAATIVPLTIAAAPFVARLVESSLRETDRGVIEAAQAMGCSTWQIITRVMIPESLPSLISGFTTAAITILSYGAMAGAVGGGGLGAVALMRGHGRSQYIVLYVSVIILMILVQIIQSIGTHLAVRMDHRIRRSGKNKKAEAQNEENAQ